MSEDSSKTEDDGNDLNNHKGRSRLCKQCKFRCTDLKEFLDHQKFAHSQDTDPDLIRSLGGRRRKSQPTKRAESRSSTDQVTEQNLSPTSEQSKKTIDVANRIDTSNEQLITDKTEQNIMEDNSDHAEEPMGDIEDLAHMNGERDFDQHSNLSHEMEDDEGRLIIAEDDQSPSGIKTPTRSGNIQNRTYVCGQCDFSSTSAKTYLHHQKDGHNADITIYECNICEYATKYKQKLPRHHKLHFSGKENSLLLNGSDLDSSFSEKDNKSTAGSDIIRMNVPMHDDEEDEIEEEEEEEETPITTVIPEAPEGEKKKRKTRQEVDPGKYFEVFDETGIKYACSKCGNVYKWRKSLNKHWKEKHIGDLPDSSKPPPGLAKLNAVSNMKYRYPVPPSERSRLTAMNHSTPHSGSSTPVMHEKMEDMSVSPVVMPRSIGPFISNAPTYYPQQKMSQHPRMSPDLGYSQHSRSLPRERPANRDEQPLDFSFHKEMNLSLNKSMDYNKNRVRLDQMDHGMYQKYRGIKQELQWGDNQNGDDLQKDEHKEENPVLQCSRCGFIAKTLVDYSSHMTLHLNKRAFKCAECQEHFNGVDDLNKHFAENHLEKIQEHKEAIQKIPHGLQQTYHLLKMPLNNIASQEISTTTEPKYLKCNMCDFVAKWPAELQKHAVSHSEERPFICMVCGSTYKWKWDLVKHFEKSHSTLQNPYKRREQNTPTASAKTSSSTPHSASSPYGGNSMYGGALQILSTTAAALVDKDQFSHKRFSNSYLQESSSKKRRLSDTELSLLEDTNNNLSRDGYITAGSVEYQSNRASSEPPKNNDLYGKGGMERSSFSTLKEMENLIPSSDDSNQSGREHFIKVKDGLTMKDADGTDILLPYKCRLCEYRARWPSEIQQHMKNHSDEKPYHCPRCSYKSKWKWDVVKHLKRCGGGTMKDVIDTTKMRKLPPPNVTVNTEGVFHQDTPQPFRPHSDMQENKQTRFVYNGFMQNMTENEQNEKVMTYECLECPFVGNSPAELKRHSVLHSENKPFSCTVCGYSSRWKCDLKKHMRTYGHENSFMPQSEDMSPMYLQDKFKLAHKNHHENQMSQMQQEDERQLYKCDQCQYATFKKFSYQAHLKMHGSANIPQETNDKFKCKQCNFKAPDLPSFLQHKKTHSTTSVASPSLQQNAPSPSLQQNGSPLVRNEDENSSSCDVSSRTLHKHRRKPSQPSQQFKCSKCAFTSFSKSSIMMHESTHEPEKMEEDNMEGQDDEYDDCKIVGTDQEYQLDASDMNQSQSKPLNFSGALDLTRSSTPVSSAHQQKPTVSIHHHAARTINQQPTNPAYPFHCEWCPAMFPNLATVYQHASQVHPNELKAQESNDKPPSSTGMSLPTRQPVPTSNANNFEHPISMTPKQALPQLQAQLQQNPMFNLYKYRPIEPKPSSASVHTTPSVASMPSTVSALTQSLQQRLNDNRAQNAVAMQLQQQAMARAKKSTSPQKRGRSFQCTKCSFTAPNAVTYLRHIERHGSNCRHTCRFCDYSIDRLNLLYQHMKGTHGDVWRGTPEEKIRLTPSGKGDDKRWGIDSESLNSSFDGSDYGQEMDMQEQLEESANREMKIYSTMAINGQKPVLTIRGMANWRGIPIQLCMINGRKNYKCPSCSYVSSNAANTGNHARQHNCGKKYCCDVCNYGADNLKLIYNHKDSIHPPEPIFVEKYEDTPFTEYEGTIDENGCSNKGPMILPTCTKCPFKCKTIKKLQKHILLHGSGEKHKCEYCDYHVGTMEELLQHLVVHREPYEPKLESSDEEDNARSTEQNESQIEQPVLTEVRMNNILNKLSNNAGQIRYKCSRCAFTAYRKSSLFNHSELHLKHPNLGEKFVQRMGNDDFTNEQADKYFQTLIIDPKDEKGLEILKNANTTEFSDHEMEDDKEFMDEGEYMDDLEGGEFVEDEIAHLEQEDLEGNSAKLRKHFSGEESDDSLAEMDPIALQQQMSMNLSGNIIQKVRYSCNQCPYRCNALRSFKCHIHMHGLNKKYICDFCNWSADRLNLLYQHRKVHQAEVGFNVAPSDIVFLNRDFALENNKSVNDYSVKSSLLEEKLNRITTARTADGKKIYICKLCPFSCSSKNSYTYHKSLHKISARYTCNECSFSVERVNLLSQHMKLHKRDVTGSPSSDIYDNKNNEPSTPEFAPQVYFNAQGSMDDSDVSQEDEYKEFKCDRCPFSTPSKDELDSHEHQHNERSQNSCPYCDFSCLKEEQLVEHLQCHFPSTKIDNETFKSIIEKQGKNSEKPLKPEVHLVKKSKSKEEEQEGEPDSTSVSEGQDRNNVKDLSSETCEKKVTAEKTYTKIYCCQYCDREFEGKSLLLLHEKQHLIGN